jgi:prepilin-type N-terminal cleavage/methylation domain-containing protein
MLAAALTKTRKRFRALHGYTLIEILVGMSIVGLIFSFGYVSYRDFARRQSLLGAARRLRADLSLAQEEALSGKKPDGLACSGAGALNGYDFFADSTTSYLIQANCSGGLMDQKTVTITEEVTMDAVPNRFTFKVIGKGTSLTVDAVITLTQAATGDIQQISVSPEGEIK